MLAEGRKLFAEKGFEAATIREITTAAAANLGAVTYHFGSKAAFHEAVLTSLLQPFRECIAEAARHRGTPLERLAHIVRELFAHLYAHPEIPRFLVHELASGRALPPVVLQTLMANHAQLSAVIADGQADGSIRPGDARLMALSIGSQPLFLNVVRRVLHDAIALDQNDETMRRAIVESVVRFVVRGLASHPEATS